MNIYYSMINYHQANNTFLTNHNVIHDAVRSSCTLTVCATSWYMAIRLARHGTWQLDFLESRISELYFESVDYAIQSRKITSVS